MYDGHAPKLRVYWRCVLAWSTKYNIGHQIEFDGVQSGRCASSWQQVFVYWISRQVIEGDHWCCYSYFAVSSQDQVEIQVKDTTVIADRRCWPRR